MATFKIRPFTPAFNRGEETFRSLPMTAAQTFKKGAVIVQNATENTYEQGAADPLAITGIALHAATDYAFETKETFNYISANGEVRIADPDQVFLGSLSDVGSASAVAIANISLEVGKLYGLVLDATSGHWVVDQAETDAAKVLARIVDIHADMADGDSNIWVYFRLISDHQEIS